MVPKSAWPPGNPVTYIIHTWWEDTDPKGWTWALYRYSVNERNRFRFTKTRFATEGEAKKKAKEAMAAYFKSMHSRDSEQVTLADFKDDELQTKSDLTRRQRHERFTAALVPFVKEFNLPFNPEELDLIAYCILEADSLSLEECGPFAEEQIAKFKRDLAETKAKHGRTA